MATAAPKAVSGQPPFETCVVDLADEGTSPVEPVAASAVLLERRHGDERVGGARDETHRLRARTTRTGPLGDDHFGERIASGLTAGQFHVPGQVGLEQTLVERLG